MHCIAALLCNTNLYNSMRLQRYKLCFLCDNTPLNLKGNIWHMGRVCCLKEESHIGNRCPFLHHSRKPLWKQVSTQHLITSKAHNYAHPKGEEEGRKHLNLLLMVVLLNRGQSLKVCFLSYHINIVCTKISSNLRLIWHLSLF